MKLLIKQNGKTIREQDYSKPIDTNDIVRDMKNVLEYIEKNKLDWTLELTK